MSPLASAKGWRTKRAKPRATFLGLFGMPNRCVGNQEIHGTARDREELSELVCLPTRLFLDQLKMSEKYRLQLRLLCSADRKCHYVVVFAGAD